MRAIERAIERNATTFDLTHISRRHDSIKTNDGECHCSYNSNCIADLCDIITLLCILHLNEQSNKLYELQKSTFDVI